MLKLNAFFSIVKLFLNIGLGGRECTYADQITLFVNPNNRSKELYVVFQFDVGEIYGFLWG